MIFSTFRRFTVLLICAAFTASCSAVDALFATPAPGMPTETPPPSPTFAWFPPSATPTLSLFSTKAPTPEMRPGLGEIILTDTFSRASLWDTATSDQASAEVNNKQLTIAARGQVYMISLRHDLVLNDFYAEIMARPSLCRAKDTYGFLVRASAVAYYRFSLGCDGTVSAERVSVGTRQILQSPVSSGDVPPGAPGEVRIGVWAVGDEMRLFLNGRFQFSITDANYGFGTVGVFASSAGDTPVVVSFSDLTVQEVETTVPAETSQP